MSKRKGVSADEKRTRLLEIFYEKKEFFQLKVNIFFKWVMYFYYPEQSFSLFYNWLKEITQIDDIFSIFSFRNWKKLLQKKRVLWHSRLKMFYKT